MKRKGIERIDHIKDHIQKIIDSTIDISYEEFE